MPTQIVGTTGVSQVQDNSIVAADLTAGMLLQHLEATPLTTYTSNSTLYAGGDATITASTGGLACTVTITPKFATSVINCRGIVNASAGAGVIWASLHKDSANAFGAARADVTAADYMIAVPVERSFIAGTTSPITITLRGHASTSSIVFNGVAAGRRGGGAFASTLVVEEIKQ